MARISTRQMELLQEVSSTIRDVDKDLLICLYKMRCLNIDMAFRFFYSKVKPFMPYCKDSLYLLEEYGLIEFEQKDCVEPDVFFLTTLGIKYVTTHIDAARSGIKKEVWDEKTGAMVNVVKSRHQLLMSGKIMNHQLSLNYFVLEYMEFADEHKIDYEYYDLIYAPKCSERMMPDGVLVLKDRIVLIEMDTGTERRRRLNERWESYRSFFARPEPFYNELPVTVLFILENISDSTARHNSFVKTICESGLISDITDNVEFYAVGLDDAKTMLQLGLDKELMNQNLFLFTAKTLVQKHGFGFYSADFTKDAGAPEFGYYICKKSGGTDSVLKLDGRPVEYLLDIWDDGRYSVLHKIIYMDRIEFLLKRAKNVQREIPYVVVVPDMRFIAGLMKYAEIKTPKNVYFTTKARIEQGLPFYEMIFTMDENLQIRHFADYSLTKTVYERKYDPKHPD